MDHRDVTIPSSWVSCATSSAANAPPALDQQARFDILYQRYYPSILGFMRFLVGTTEVAEDLTSMAFEKAWAHRHDVQSANVGGWLFRIARNCAVDYARRHKPMISLECLLPEDHPQGDAVEEEALAQAQRESLLAHLNRLSPREREVIGLKFVANLSNREIAHVLQLPVGTVGSLLFRTLRRLRCALVAEGGNHETRS